MHLYHAFFVIIYDYKFILILNNNINKKNKKITHILFFYFFIYNFILIAIQIYYD